MEIYSSCPAWYHVNMRLEQMCSCSTRVYGHHPCCTTAQAVTCYLVQWHQHSVMQQQHAYLVATSPCGHGQMVGTKESLLGKLWAPGNG